MPSQAIPIGPDFCAFPIATSRSRQLEQSPAARTEQLAPAASTSEGDDDEVVVGLPGRHAVHPVECVAQLEQMIGNLGNQRKLAKSYGAQPQG